MLAAGVSHRGGLRIRRHYRSLIRNKHMRDVLLWIRHSIVQSPGLGLDSSAVSVKVWLLPPWYANDFRQGGGIKTDWADALAERFGHPTVVLGGELLPENHCSSNSCWALRKGLIGSVLFEISEEGWNSVSHDDNLHLAGMTWLRYRKRSRDESQGLSRRDVRALCACYSVSVAAALRTDRESSPFGCVTVDSLNPGGLTDDQETQLGSILVAAVPRIVNAINSWGEYTLVRQAHDLQRA